jgi:hypothetical protein
VIEVHGIVSFPRFLQERLCVELSCGGVDKGMKKWKGKGYRRWLLREAGEIDPELELPFLKASMANKYDGFPLGGDVFGLSGVG